MMRWEKLGQIYTPPKKGDFLTSHAANPLAIHLQEDIYRIFYSGRSLKNKSSVGCVDIDIIQRKIIKEYDNVLLKHGESEEFHSHGISIGNHYSADNTNYILFMAWKIENTQSHWYGTVGRIELKEKNNLKLNPAKPFMALDEEDPVSLSYPWVMFDEGIYKMWYGSTVSWKANTNDEMIHVIKYATSEDGENWKKHGVAVPYEENIAQAFSRPTVAKINDTYHMWYSYRSGTGKTYRIGYAQSLNGIDWNRLEDTSDIDVSKSGWDSEMVCYPYVLEHKGGFYMLYNGNGYGQTGFGLARLVI